MVTVAGAGETNLMLQMPLQSQFFAKPVNEDYSTKVSKVLFSDGNLSIHESFWHSAQGIQLVRAVNKHFLGTYHSYCPSVLQGLLLC